MANTILIRRSTTASDPGLVLGAGELAFSYVSNRLFIGNSNGAGSASIALGGPGLFADYATIASPALTGTPSAPTAAVSDNSTTLATTAFVKNQNYISANQTITISGDASGNGSTSINLTLSTTGVGAGTYTKITVDAKGRATAGTTLSSTDIPSLLSSKISDFDTQVRNSRLDQMALPIASMNFNNVRLGGVASPVNPTDAANKQYVDAARSGLDTKDSVRVASTVNVNISSPGATVDSVVLIAGDRILLKDQTTPSQNGIYVWTNSTTALNRSTDADSNSEVTSGMYTYVSEGTVNANSGWVLSTPDPINLGVTSLTFVQFSGAGSVVAGAGLYKTGSQLDIGTASSSRIVINADAIDLAATGITAGTYNSTTVDAYGRVTAGTNPTTLSGYGITDAQPLNPLLSAVASLTGAGIISRLSASTAASRTITGVSNRTTVINGNGVSGDPTIDISSSYVGQPSITTVGTISTGVWQGTVVAINYGGTGTNSTFSGIVKSNGSSYSAAVPGIDILTPSSIIEGGNF